MTLGQYLTLHSIRPAEFARRIKVPTSTITRLLNKQRRPSIDMVIRIERETLKAVAMIDWVQPSAHGSRHLKRPNVGSKRSPAKEARN